MECCDLAIYSLADYNKLLAEGLPSDKIHAEALKLRIACEKALDDYIASADKDQGKFVRVGGLPYGVLGDNPATPALQDAYDRISILMGYLGRDDREWRDALIMTRMSVAACCQMVYDLKIWSHGE